MNSFDLLRSDTMTLEDAWAGHEKLGTATLPPGVVSSEDPDYWRVGGPPPKPRESAPTSLQERVLSRGHRVDHLDLDENGFVKDNTFDPGTSGQDYVAERLKAKGFKGACCGSCAGGGSCEGCGGGSSGKHKRPGPHSAGPITPWPGAGEVGGDDDPTPGDIGGASVGEQLAGEGGGAPELWGYAKCCDGTIVFGPLGMVPRCKCPDGKRIQAPPGTKICCPCPDGTEMRKKPPYCPEGGGGGGNGRNTALLFNLPTGPGTKLYLQDTEEEGCCCCLKTMCVKIRDPLWHHLFRNAPLYRRIEVMAHADLKGKYKRHQQRWCEPMWEEASFDVTPKHGAYRTWRHDWNDSLVETAKGRRDKHRIREEQRENGCPTKNIELTITDDPGGLEAVGGGAAEGKAYIYVRFTGCDADRCGPGEEWAFSTGYGSVTGKGYVKCCHALLRLHYCQDIGRPARLDIKVLGPICGDRCEQPEFTRERLYWHPRATIDKWFTTWNPANRTDREPCNSGHDAGTKCWPSLRLPSRMTRPGTNWPLEYLPTYPRPFPPRGPYRPR